MSRRARQRAGAKPARYPQHARPVRERDPDIPWHEIRSDLQRRDAGGQQQPGHGNEHPGSQS